MGQGNIGVAGRAREPEVAGVRIGEGSRPSIRIDGSATIGVVDPEVEVRPGRGARAAGYPDDLAALDTLALGDADLREVTVVREQAVAVADLHSEAAQAAVA